MIKVRELTKFYNDKIILNNLTFNIPDQSFTTIFGPNGCGKTTLLNILTGLDKDYRGKIDDSNISKYKIGYVFQDYRKSLLPWLSVKENILFPLKIQGIKKSKQEKKLAELIEFSRVELNLDQKTYSLSGGQAQLICILRALIITPKILILDEPFAALDYEKTIFLRELISNLAKKMQLTVIFISHDLEEAIMLGDQVIFLSKNPTKIVEILEIPLTYPRCPEQLISNEFNKLRQNSMNIFKRCLN